MDERHEAGEEEAVSRRALGRGESSLESGEEEEGRSGDRRREASPVERVSTVRDKKR